jgi:hypothetical protein
MLGAKSITFNHVFFCWTVNANTTKYKLQYWLANFSNYWNTYKVWALRFRMGIFNRIIWNSLCLDWWGSPT